MIGILKHNPLTLIGTLMVVFIILLGAAAPLVCPYDPNLMDVPSRLQAPSANHFFGTDEMGRDVFTRVVYGARIFITVGLSIVIIAATVGCFFGR